MKDRAYAAYRRAARTTAKTMKDRAYAAYRRAARTAKTSPSQDAARYWWTVKGTADANRALTQMLKTATPEQVRHAQQQISDQSRDALTTCSANAAQYYAHDWGKAQRILQLLEERES